MMSKVQFWAIMYLLCNIISNGEKTAHMERQWGVFGILCSLMMVWAMFKEKKEKE